MATLTPLDVEGEMKTSQFAKFKCFQESSLLPQGGFKLQSTKQNKMTVCCFFLLHPPNLSPLMTKCKRPKKRADVHDIITSPQYLCSCILSSMRTDGGGGAHYCLLLLAGNHRCPLNDCEDMSMCSCSCGLKPHFCNRAIRRLNSD